MARELHVDASDLYYDQEGTLFADFAELDGMPMENLDSLPDDVTVVIHGDIDGIDVPANAIVEGNVSGENINIGEGATISGDIGGPFTVIERIGNDVTVNGNIGLGGEPPFVNDIGDNLHVTGDMKFLAGGGLDSLGDGMNVDGDITIAALWDLKIPEPVAMENSIRAEYIAVDPDSVTIDENGKMHYPMEEYADDGTKIVVTADRDVFEETALTGVSDENLEAAGVLNLEGKGVTELPDNLVAGELRLEGNPGLTELPKGLSVNFLFLEDNPSIDKLPEDAHIVKADISGTNIEDAGNVSDSLYISEEQYGKVSCGQSAELMIYDSEYDEFIPEDEYLMEHENNSADDPGTDDPQEETCCLPDDITGAEEETAYGEEDPDEDGYAAGIDEGL